MNRFWLLLLALFLGLNGVHAQSDEQSFVRLTSFWNAPGSVEAITPDNRHILIYDETSDITRLVEMRTGYVQVERPGRNRIRFSPDGQFLVVYDAAAQTYQIVEIDTQQTVIQIPSGIPKFSPDGHYLLNTWRDEHTPYTTQVIDLQAGKILFEAPGMNASISPDGHWMALFYYGDGVVVVHELPAGNIVAQIAPINVGNESPSATSEFFPDGRTLAVRQYFSATQLIDINTWETRYSQPGSIRPTPNDRYYLVRFTDGSTSPMHLIDADTGEVLYEVDGNMSVSPDGKLLYLSAFETYEDKTIQVVDLATGNVLTEQRGWITLQLVEDNQLIEIHDQSTHTTRYIEVGTGITRWEVAGSAWMFDDERHLALVDESQMVDVSTGDVLGAGEHAVVSPDGAYVFIMQGSIVDVYGAPPEMRVDSMPEPRP